MGDQQAGGGRPPPTFTTLPIRACSDKRLTGTDLRVLGVISFHDRRSLARGVGAGCFAGQRIIAQRAGLDRKNVRLSIERLVQFGYLDRQERASEKRGYVLRVIEVDPNAPADPIGGAGTPYADDDDEAVDYFEGVQEPPQAGVQEPPHRGCGDPHNRDLRDLVETRRDSTEVAHFSQSASDEISTRQSEELSTGAICQGELRFLVIIAANILGSHAALHQRSGVPTNYISRAKNAKSIPHDHEAALVTACDQVVKANIHRHPPFIRFGEFGVLLPADFDAKSHDVQLHHLEKALKLVPGHKFVAAAEEQIDEFLAEICENHCGEGSGHRAQRMREELDRWLPA